MAPPAQPPMTSAGPIKPTGNPSPKAAALVTSLRIARAMSDPAASSPSMALLNVS